MWDRKDRTRGLEPQRLRDNDALRQRIASQMSAVQANLDIYEDHIERKKETSLSLRHDVSGGWCGTRSHHRLIDSVCRCFFGACCRINLLRRSDFHRILDRPRESIEGGDRVSNGTRQVTFQLTAPRTDSQRNFFNLDSGSTEPNCTCRICFVTK